MTMIRNWLAASLLVVPLGLLILAAITVGYGLPPTGWMAALHFETCTLPCWLGIVPGETTLAEARAVVGDALRGSGEFVKVSDSSLQGRERYFVRAADARYVFQASFFAENAESPIQLIMLEIGERVEPPTLAMFYPLLNQPTEIQDILHVNSMAETHLFFENEAVVLTVYDSACEKFRPDQNINQILLYAGFTTPASAEAWQGFRQHYGPC
jgi:hypothetical protein